MVIDTDDVFHSDLYREKKSKKDHVTTLRDIFNKITPNLVVPHMYVCKEEKKNETKIDEADPKSIRTQEEGEEEKFPLHSTRRQTILYFSILLLAFDTSDFPNSMKSFFSSIFVFCSHNESSM